MKPIVYLDMLFLMNFFIDTLVLLGTAFLIKKTLCLWRIALSSSLSAFYSTVMFFPQISFLYSIVFKVVFLFFSVWIAFPSYTIKALFKNALMFFASNLIFGGIMFFLIFFTDFGTTMNTFVSNGEIYFNISSKTLIFSIILAYLVIYAISFIKKENMVASRKQVDITVFFENKTVDFKALCDTGCTLCDPISGFPAIILSPKCAKQLFPKELLCAIRENTIPAGYETKLRVLPFSTIDTPLEIMYGIIPDKILFEEREIKKAIIAISNTDFGKKSGFSGILNPHIFDFYNNESACEYQAERNKNESETPRF
ncbi:MAG: sigma-E processing peptidase SpoIIGA [Clostridia bacterium]|nr:sigma-E processing peptidase SpoIIGA [Clostridia bacterium]